MDRSLLCAFPLFLLAASAGAANVTISDNNHTQRASHGSAMPLSQDAVVMLDQKSRGSKNVSLPSLGSSPRILIYMTTACSTNHLKCLQSCWPRSMQAAPLLVTSDVLVYAGCADATFDFHEKHRRGNRGTTNQMDVDLNRSKWIDALVSLPNANVSLVWRHTNPGRQLGAIEALLYAARRSWFDAYDWVVRVNPDVIFISATFLEAKLREAGTTAVLADCRHAACGIRAGQLPEQVPRHHPLNCFNPIVHTDFFAARPRSMDNELWEGEPHAETAASKVFKRAVGSTGAVVFYKGGPARNPFCRIHSHGIEHTHSLCTNPNEWDTIAEKNANWTKQQKELKTAI